MPYHAVMGCGFQTGAGTVLNVLKPQREDSVVIFRMGGVGLSASMAAIYLGVQQIVAIDLLANKLELAKELGASDLIDPSKVPDAVAEIKKICSKNSGASFAIDCTGVLKVIEQCIEALCPRGIAVSVGVPPPESKISLDPLMFLLENKRYIGVIEGDLAPAQFIPELVKLHQEGHFPVDPLCKVYPVADMEHAIHEMHDGKVIRPVLQW